MSEEQRRQRGCPPGSYVTNHAARTLATNGEIIAIIETRKEQEHRANSRRDNGRPCGATPEALDEFVAAIASIAISPGTGIRDGSAPLTGGAFGTAHEAMTIKWHGDNPRIRREYSHAKHAGRRTPAPGDSSPTVVGVRISHPHRIIYPELGISKIQFARYYERIADWILPHVAGRPLTLVHCPSGTAAPCHFLKHAKAWGPSALQRVRIREKTKIGEYLVANSIEAVVSLAQMGIVEIHTWNSTVDDIERPNRLVWDLDPGPEVSWKDVIKAARLVRDVLETLKLRSWVKTTGGRGLHVVVPLQPKRTVRECLDFSRTVSEAIARTDPQSYTTAFAKSGREQKVLIDYLRNNRTNTSVCAFSPRARTGATVSMPLHWNDLREPPGRWTILTVPRRLARIRADPWKDYWPSNQTISAASFAAVTRVSSR